MGVNYKSAQLPYGAEKLPLIGVHQKLLVIQQPLLIHVVDEEISLIYAEFQPEKHLDTYFVPDRFRLLIANAKKLYALIPGQFPRHGGVAVEKVIGDKDAVVAQFFVSKRHFHRGRS